MLMGDSWPAERCEAAEISETRVERLLELESALIHVVDRESTSEVRRLSSESMT